MHGQKCIQNRCYGNKFVLKSVAMDTYSVETHCFHLLSNARCYDKNSTCSSRYYGNKHVLKTVAMDTYCRCYGNKLISKLSK